MVTGAGGGVSAPAVPSIVVAWWAAGVALLGGWMVVLTNWPSALTMVLGSFVAGSTPQGGGAVAFPVFTKLLDVEPAAARTFALSIQAVGMTSASVSMWLRGRDIDWGLLRRSVPAGVIGLMAGLVAQTWWTPPSVWVRVGFTALIASMTLVVVSSERLRGTVVLSPSASASIALAGGAIVSLVGSGLDVVVYVVLVMAGRRTASAVATSVVAMAALSVVGLGATLLGLGGGGSIADLDGLGGMWLAAVPVVAVGAPLGAAVAAALSERALTSLIVVCGLVEVVSTLVLVPELRTNPVMAAMAGGTVALAAVAVRRLGRRSAPAADAQEKPMLIPPQTHEQPHVAAPAATAEAAIPLPQTAAPAGQLPGRRLGVMSPAGANRPEALYCRESGVRLGAQMTRRVTPSPYVPVAVLVFSDGTSRSVVTSTTLGSAVDADITLQDEQASVSREHCRLIVDGWSIHLEDLGSTNGTWVESDPGWARLSAPRRLEGGDRFVLGTIIATVHPPI